MAYSAYITKLSKVQKDPNSDNLYTALAMNEGVIVGGDAYEGQRVIYFPADGQLLDYDFCVAFELLRKDKEGNKLNGYLDANRHIKALRLRGLRSEGIVIDLAKFAAYYKLTAEDFKNGEQIDSIGKLPICKKYIPPQKFSSTPKTSKRGKKRDGIEFPEFEMHIDTQQYNYNRDQFQPGDAIFISEKVHGTSQRSMKTYALLPNGFFRRLFHLPQRRKSMYVLGTRRVVLLDENDQSGFYNENSFRWKHHKQLEPYIEEGMEVFYEVCGYINETTPIMPSGDNTKIGDKEFTKKYGKTTNFTYGCEPGESKIFVYRITKDGVEYTSNKLAIWCTKAGVQMVPALRYFAFQTIEELDAEVERLQEGPSTIDNRHTREGVVVRIENRPKFTAFKSKNLAFKILEGIVKSTAAEADIEEAQDA